MLLVVKYVDRRNCFVNLPPHLASALLSKEKEPHSIVFEIKWGRHERQKHAFVGWGGEMSSDGSVLEVPVEFAKNLGLREHQEVEIATVQHIQDAEQVHVVPISPNDWEIIALHQEYLEQQLLNQIRVLFKGQSIPLWIRGGTKVNLKIEKTTPTTCVRIVRNSEVIVAPCLRKTSTFQDDMPSSVFKSNFHTISSSKRKRATLRVLPHHHHFHKNQLEYGYIIIHKKMMNWFNCQSGDVLVVSLPNREKIVGNTIERTEEEEKQEEERGSGGGGRRNRSYIEDGKLGKEFVVRVKTCEETHIKPQHIIIDEKTKRMLGVVTGQSVHLMYPDRILLQEMESSTSGIHSIRSVVLHEAIWPSTTTTTTTNSSSSSSSSSTTTTTISKFDVNTSKYDVDLDSTKYHNAVQNAFRNWIIQDEDEDNDDYSSLSVVSQGGLIRLSIPTRGELDFILYYTYIEEEEEEEEEKGREHLIHPIAHQLRARHLTCKLPLPYEVVIADPIFFNKSIDDMTSHTRLDVMGGMDRVAEELVSLVGLQVLHKRVRGVMGTHTPRGMVLLHGGHGCGKTTLAVALANHFKYHPHCNAYIEVMKCAELVGMREDAVLVRWKQLFARGTRYAPSVLVLDDLDLLLPNEQEEYAGIRSTQLAELLIDHISELQAFSAQGRGGRGGYDSIYSRDVAVLVTTQEVQSLHPLLQTIGPVCAAVPIPLPDRTGRLDILHKTVDTLLHTTCPTHVLNNMAKSTEGYVGADLKVLVERARLHASTRWIDDNTRQYGGTDGEKKEEDNRKKREHHVLNVEKEEENGVEKNVVGMMGLPELVLSHSDFNDALEGFTPTSLKGIELHKSETSWEDIGGLEKVKEVLLETLEWPSKYSTLFTGAPLRLRSGLLLYGPPGTGKTLLGSAVAGSLGLNFISVKGPEVLNKYIGASEQAVRQLFQRAQAAKPCVLFFDEFEAVAPRRGHDSTGVTDRVVNQLLTQLDGVEGLDGVYVLAATSRPDLIDPALLRPGRLDKALFCNIPTPQERESILHVLTQNYTLDLPEGSILHLANITEYYTGADLRALVHQALLESIHEQLDEDKQYLGDNDSSFSSSSSSSFDHLSLPSNMIHVLKFGEGRLTRGERTTHQHNARNIHHLYKQGKINTNNIPKHIGEKEILPKSRESTLTITLSHFEKAFESTGPSVSIVERKKYQRIYHQFIASRGGEFGMVDKQIGSHSTLA